MTLPLCRFLAAAAAAGLLAMGAHAADAPDEPPPEAREGADYEVEAADSLEASSIEIGLGASGRPGAGPRRTRRVRVRGEGLNAAVREGRGDALSGGVIEGRVGGGTLLAGRLAPRWGRGLVLGAPAEPWSMRANDRGRTAFGGRAGEGLCFRRGDAAEVELLAGRFRTRHLAGGGMRARGFGLGALTEGGGRRQSSASFGTSHAEAEIAFDERGRWRADALHVRAVSGVRVASHVRAGLSGFRSLAEPLRAGPARLLNVSVSDGAAPTPWRALGSLWQFRRAVSGARGAFQIVLPAPSGGWQLGVEAQRGARRPPTASSRPRGVRQGAWAEWISQRGPLTLGLRQELWGSRGLRRAVRRVSAARAELEAVNGVRVRVAHTMFRTAFGERLYLKEIYSDRLVLRALSGRGERTRFELRVPMGGGRLTASLDLTRTRGKPARVLWTLDWSRRTRTRR